jgi:hypothetical protein
MARRCIVLLAIMFLMPGIALAQNQPEDEISKLLFEAYLNGPRKTNTSTVMAASHIVAERGRMSGFWRDVLAELSSGDEHSEVNCVRILGNMLATDAAARDAIRRQKETGEVSAWIPSVHIGPEVVEDLLKRGTTCAGPGPGNTEVLCINSQGQEGRRAGRPRCGGDGARKLQPPRQHTVSCGGGPGPTGRSPGN